MQRKMRMRRAITGALGAALLAGAAGSANAAPKLRIQVDLRGDFVLIGNTLGHDCANGVPAPITGTVGPCGNNGINDAAPDVFWRADSPAISQAEANTSKKYGGTGLGLALTRRFCHSMGGTVEVESQPSTTGRGARGAKGRAR